MRISINHQASTGESIVSAICAFSDEERIGNLWHFFWTAVLDFDPFGRPLFTVGSLIGLLCPADGKTWILGGQACESWRKQRVWSKY